ncbi:MAG: ACT domain-containing protein [Candidatus Micrarchaeota archaeon]
MNNQIQTPRDNAATGNNANAGRSAAKYGGGLFANAYGVSARQAYERAAGLSVKNGTTLSVVSAAGGVTDLIISALGQASKKTQQYHDSFDQIYALHEGIYKTGTTDSMHKGLRAILQKTCSDGGCDEQTRAIAESYGERISAYMFSKISGFTLIEPSEAGLISNQDSSFLNSTISIREGTILNHGCQYVMGGYYATDREGHIRLTGRGGSDYTAAMVAAAIGASSLELWKNVDGVMSADPRLVQNTVLRPQLSFHEASALAYYGMKIIHPRAPEAVRGRGISFNVRNFYSESGSIGTQILENKTTNGFTIAYKQDISRIDVSSEDMASNPGYASRIFSLMADAGISVDIISTSQTSISFTIKRENSEAAFSTLEKNQIGTTTLNPNASLMTIIADNVDFATLTSKTFGAISSAGISGVDAISKGSNLDELNIVTREDLLQPLMQAVHDGLLRK